MLAVTAASVAALPASALAAGESLSVTPSNLQAGGSPSISATYAFAASDTPKTVVTSLAAGVLANLNANPSCLVGAPELTPSCGIGSASVTTNPGGTAPGNLYLVPPQSSTDAAGIDLVTTLSPTPQYIGVSLNPNTPGGLNLTTTFPDTSPADITGFTADFSSALDGQPFTRLPSYCNDAVTTMSVTYYGATAPSSAASSFTPTGCATLSYAPVLTAAIARDTGDTGATITAAITQSAGQAASKAITLQLPRGLVPNLVADAPCLNSTGCKVGTATATSPLVPKAALANGTVTLSGSGTTSAITIAFPAPFPISLTGAISLTSRSVTFASVPDVPLTSLALSITGPSGAKAFNTDCAPASIGGTFTSYSSATRTVTAPIVYTHCAASPTVSGSTSGLAGGQPKLKVTITHGKGAANIATVVLALPGGLKFSRAAIVSHRTCTKAAKGKTATCSITTTITGLGVSGGMPKSVAIHGGKLQITLKRPVGKLTLTVSGPLVSEGKSLQSKVKKHKTGSLTFSLKVGDAKHATTTLSLKLKPH
ncbi:MAG: hypothetical protein JO130_11985 [Solirubrobacterales bacterium]|nr:hypothetical protein [Solirubrobacterales bacterium]